MKKPAKPVTPCPSTASGGVLKCVLEAGHAGGIHSSNAGKARQYATWALDGDGRIKVTTFVSKRKDSEWTEDPPVNVKLAAVGYCGAKFESYARADDTCVLVAGHEGGHENTSTGTREVDPDEHFKAQSTKVPALTDNCPKCKHELGEHDGTKCPKPTPAKKVSKIFTETERAAMAKKESPPPTSPKVTKIGEHEVHPAAALFPMIGDAEYPSFLEDIRANGQRKRIVRIGKLILDGRNRLRACLEVGVEPLFRAFGDDPSDGSDPIAFVVSENIHRRHLNETQRAFVGAELVPMYEAQAKERMLAGRSDPSPNAGQGKATEQAARAVNVGKTSIEAALKVNRDGAPEVIAAAKERGQMKVSTAAQLATLPKQKQREIADKLGGGELRSGKVRALVNQEKKRAVVQRINEQKVAPLPMGPFGVIYGDYPWPYDNSDQHEGSRGHLGYPTMTLEQIVEHARETATRAAKDCVIALWVTNLHVVNIGRVVEAFGASHHTMLTWPKPKAGVGSWPRGQTEHVVIASIGSPVHTLNEITTLLKSYQPEHPGEHSSKPAEVAELLRKHCSGPFLELFARGPREGFEVWGAETSKFETEAA